jgi:hypothetical protein
MDLALAWQEHINKMTRKLNLACFVNRSFKLILTTDDLKIVYFVHSVITYGILLGKCYQQQTSFCIPKQNYKEYYENKF